MPSAATLNATPLSTGANAAAAVRTVLVMPAVAVRSWGSTTAIVYDFLVGTSICETLMRSRKNNTASHQVGASGTSISNTLEGKWVKTIVLSSPMRLASGAAPKNDRPDTTFTQKKTMASVSIDRPQRR